MLKVSISVVPDGKSVSVKLSDNVLKQGTRAILLGASGEHLRTFTLTQASSELLTEDFGPGAYTLRIEAGNEVFVKQIRFP